MSNDSGQVSDERLQDIVNNYHGDIRTIALELQKHRKQNPPEPFRPVRTTWVDFDQHARKFRLDDE